MGMFHCSIVLSIRATEFDDVGGGRHRDRPEQAMSFFYFIACARTWDCVHAQPLALEPFREPWTRAPVYSTIRHFSLKPSLLR